MRIAANSKSRGPQGAVMIEFLAVLPLLLLFVGGVFELGRYFCEVSWVAQAGYQVAVVGAMNVPNTASSKRMMQQRYQQMTLIQKPGHLVEDAALPLETVYASSGDQIKVRVRGTFHSTWKGWMHLAVPMDVAVVGPILVRNMGNIGCTASFCNAPPATCAGC
jgi:hypothetical protein